MAPQLVQAGLVSGRYFEKGRLIMALETGYTPTIPNPLRDFARNLRHYEDMHDLGFDDCECNSCRDYLIELAAAYAWNDAITREATRKPKPTPSICDVYGRVKNSGEETRSDTNEKHLARYGY